MERVDVVAISTPVREGLARLPDYARATAAIGPDTLHWETRSELLGRSLPCLIVAHEASHAALACHYRGWEPGTRILVNEGRGSFSRNAQFRFDAGRLCLQDHDRLPWYGTGFGWSGLGYLLGLGSGPAIAGKVMAIGGYGEANDRDRERLETLPRDLHHRPRGEAERASARLAAYLDTSDFDAQANLVRTFQTMFDEAVMALLSNPGADHTGPLALGGGCGLNLGLNTRVRALLDPQVGIAPACNDAGQALGAGLYATLHYDGVRPSSFPATSNGLPVREQDCLDALNRAGLEPRAFDPYTMADTLARGHIVALATGAPALGPRALGHRSLLAHAAHRGVRKRLSMGIKGREWYRPLAPLMRAEALAQLVPGAQPSPHMLFAVDLPPDVMPEATHVDGTARVQTLTDDACPRLSAVLDAFVARTGTPGLINTSLNRLGRAIAYRPQDVIDDLLGTDVALIALGPYMAAAPRVAEA